MKIKAYSLGLVLPAMMLSAGVMAVESGENNFCGFYTGGSVGGSFTTSHVVLLRDIRTFVSIQDGLYTVSTPNNVSVEQPQRKNNVATMLYTGYGYAFQDFYLSVEAFLTYSNYKVKSMMTSSNGINLLEPEFNDISLIGSSSSSTTIYTKLRRFEPGIDFRPGIFLSSCALLYGRVGIAYNKVSLTSKMNDSTNIVGIGPLELQFSAVNAFDAFHKNKNIVALRLGIGFEQNICDNVNIRVDYIHTRYRGITTGKRTQTINNITGLTLTQNSSSILKSFSNNSVMLGISYYW